MARFEDTQLNWEAGAILGDFHLRGSVFTPERHDDAFRVLLAATALDAMPEPTGRWSRWRHRQREARVRQAVETYKQKYAKPFGKFGD